MPYSEKPEDRDSYRGKQFSVAGSKPEPFKPLFEVGCGAAPCAARRAGDGPAPAPQPFTVLPPPRLLRRASSSLTGCRTASCSPTSRPRRAEGWARDGRKGLPPRRVPAALPPACVHARAPPPGPPLQGFMTSDYSKRDEFSLTIRMEQHREIIKVRPAWRSASAAGAGRGGRGWGPVPCHRHPAASSACATGPQHEARMQKAAEAKLAATGGAAAAGAGGGTDQAGSGGGSEHKGDGPLLFDLVHEGKAELCIKVRRREGGRGWLAATAGAMLRLGA